MKARNLKNQRFGRLEAICQTEKRRSGNVIWLCRCDCGNLAEVPSNLLVIGNTSSCGCLSRERVGKINYKHGLRETRLYQTWAKMKRRCYSVRSHAFRWYGGRGIIVCLEWEDDFMCFYKWALRNGYESNLSIDRIDNDGDYEPDNCQWITRSENMKKRHRDARLKKEKK